VVVTVADDGPGFEPARREEAVRQDRFGLVGIQERLASVGGRGQVESVPGEGTTVRLAVPVPAAARAALAARDDDPPRLALRLS
jgi:signal transduction histidine kinase